MTDEEIIYKAIQKARLNGWDGTVPKDFFTIRGVGLIFQHSFAKAIFGDSIIPFIECKDLFDHNRIIAVITMPACQAEIQRMALEEKPLQHLAKFL